MAHELRTRARSSGHAAVERRTAFIGPTPPTSERVPPRMWCTVNHLGMMTYSERWEADCPLLLKRRGRIFFLLFFGICFSPHSAKVCGSPVCGESLVHGLGRVDEKP